MKRRSEVCVSVLFLIVVRQLDAQVDLPSVMMSYINVCGPGYSCYDWSASIQMPNGTKNYTKQNLCQECSCDNACFQLKNCCPDKYFSRTYTKYKSVIVNYPASMMESGVPQKYAIVDYCPPHSDSVHKYRCEHWTSPYDVLVNPPVTSSTTNVSYQSRHCAYCNGENEADLQEWLLTVDQDCMLRRSIFYLSSHAEILSYAQNYSCALVFSPRHNSHVIQRRDTIQEYRDRCNFTGTWAEFDPHVQMACESSYDPLYRIYTNIFCAMCNPIKSATNHVTSSCNVTGEWREYDASLEKACKENPEFQMTNPYKNVFCLFCNSREMPSESNNDLYSYNDAKLSVREFITNSKTYMYEFDRVAFHNKFLHEEIKKNIERNHATEQYFSGVMTINDKQINITYLLMKSLSLLPARVCDKTLVPPIARNFTLDDCQCHPQCMLAEPCQCCLDVALSWPITCVQDSYHPNPSKLPKMMTVFNGCRRIDNRFDGSPFYATIRRMCERNISSTDQVPVTSDGLTYRNIYCYLCNNQINITEVDLEIPPTPYNAWGAKIECSDELNIYYPTKYTDILSFARSDSRCSLWFNTARSFECPQGIRWSPTRCNETNQLDIVDPAVHWACEGSHYNRYISTVFCLHCNPRAPLADDVIIDTCDNTSMHYNPVYDEACQLFPDAVVSGIPLPTPRIKNRFCGLCNSPCIDYSCEEPTRPGDCTSNPGSSAVRPPLLNQLFRFSGVIADLNEHEEISSTNHVCFPGKTLSGGNCSLLFQVGVRAIYTLNFQVNITLESSNGNGDLNITKSLVSVLIDIKWRLLQIFPNEIKEQFVFLTEETYYWNNTSKAAQGTATVYIQTEALGFYDRARAEDALFNFPSTFIFSAEEIMIVPGNFTLFPSISITAKGVQHVRPYIVKNSRVKPPSKYREYLVSLDKSFLRTPLENIIVSPLLFCTQIEYKSSDFEVDYIRFEMILKATNQRFTMNQFVVSLDGSIQVCDGDIKWPILVPSIDDNATLRIFTLTCTGVSLFCLLVTFFIYCFFKTLRTIPGLNLMSLVFSLFCAQLLFIFSDNKEDKFWCPVVGILLHYFWLSTCFCLLICCFHMYRVFNSQELVRSGIYFTSRTFYRYITFSYSLPLVIVGSNVGVMFGVNGTLGYGEQICFVENIISNILIFIVPLVLTCCINCFFFFKTIRGISAASRLRDDKASEVKTFIKLFSITGLVWTVQIVDAFVRWTPLAYLSTALICLQGCFIFFSFCFSKTTVRLWKENRMSRLSKTASFSMPVSDGKMSKSEDLDRPTPRLERVQAGKYVQ